MSQRLRPTTRLGSPVRRDCVWLWPRRYPRRLTRNSCPVRFRRLPRYQVSATHNTMKTTINAATTLGRNVTAATLTTTPAMVLPTSIRRHLRARSVASIRQTLLVLLVAPEVAQFAGLAHHSSLARLRILLPLGKKQEPRLIRTQGQRTSKGLVDWEGGMTDQIDRLTRSKFHFKSVASFLTGLRCSHVYPVSARRHPKLTLTIPSRFADNQLVDNHAKLRNYPKDSGSLNPDGGLRSVRIHLFRLWHGSLRD